MFEQQDHLARGVIIERPSGDRRQPSTHRRADGSRRRISDRMVIQAGPNNPCKARFVCPTHRRTVGSEVDRSDPPVERGFRLNAGPIAWLRMLHLLRDTCKNGRSAV